MLPQIQLHQHSLSKPVRTRWTSQVSICFKTEAWIPRSAGLNPACIMDTRAGFSQKITKSWRHRQQSECLASRCKAPGSVLAISISLLLSPLSLPVSHLPSLSYSYSQRSPHKDQAIIKSHGVKLSRGDSHGPSVSGTANEQLLS